MRHIVSRPRFVRRISCPSSLKPKPFGRVTASVEITPIGKTGRNAVVSCEVTFDDLEVPGVGTFKATMINAGIPTIFLNAADLGYTGTELQDAINGDPQALARFEAIRAHGAVRMGLIERVEQAATRQHTPKVAFVAPPADHVAGRWALALMVVGYLAGELADEVPGLLHDLGS